MLILQAGNTTQLVLNKMASRLAHICLDKFHFATSCSKKNKNVRIQFVSPLLEGRIKRGFYIFNGRGMEEKHLVMY